MLELAKPGTIIIADNVVRDGAVIDEINVDEINVDERVQGVRRFMDLLQEESQIESTAIQTVGNKGYDDFVLAVVK